MATLEELRARADQRLAAAGDVGKTFWGTVGDMAASLGAGVVRGAVELGMAPATLKRAGEGLVRGGFDALDKALGREELPQGEIGPQIDAPLHRGQDAIRAGMDANLYEPRTTPGRYAATVGEFIPGAGVLAAGSKVGAAMRYGVAPGLASEYAGQQFAGTAMEPWVRAGAAVVAGGLSALTQRPSTAGAALRNNLPKGATAADIDAAETAIQRAQSQGISISWPEALAQVTNRRVDITDVQRLLEQSIGGRQVFSEFMSERPGQARRAMETEADLTFGPAQDPTGMGLRIQHLSKGALTNIRRQINRMTDADYARANGDIVPQAEWDALFADPLAADALRTTLQTPVYNRMLGGLPERSVRYVDAVKRTLDDMASAFERGGNNTAASSAGQVARQARQTGIDASPAYERALETQARTRQGVLNPAESGPLGRMAGTDQMRTQIDALFHADPLEGTDRVVGQTVRRLVRQDPVAASSLIRTHVKRVFDEATQQLQSGPNQWGSANFVARLVGNDQQMRNLRAAVHALPGGQGRWLGFQRLLQTLEATGKRQHPGSPTAANQQLNIALAQGSPTGTVVSLASSPTSALGQMREWYQQFKLGQNTEELARILTDPNSGSLLRQLASARTMADRERIVAVLMHQGTQELTSRAQTGRRF